MKRTFRRAMCIAMTIASLAALTGAQSPPTAATSSALPSDADIRRTLADRIDVQHKSVGMVVGIITPQGRRITSYGQAGQGDGRPLNGDTVFEIGSGSSGFRQ